MKKDNEANWENREEVFVWGD